MRRAAKARPARSLNPRAKGQAAAVAAANRAAALAANSHEASFARDKALFIGGSFDDADAVPGRNDSPEAPGKKSSLSPAAQRARRREGAARFGRKAMSVFMAIVLAIGLMPLPAFGDDGQVKGVSFNGNLIAGSISTTTTVDADGNVTTETTQTKVDDEGNVVSETTAESEDSGGLDSDANLRGQYFLSQATALKSDGTIQDLAGTDGIGKVSDDSDSRLSVAAGAAALEQKQADEEQSAVDEAQAAFDAEDAAIDVSDLGDLDFSSQRIVVALKDGASLQERDLNNVTSKADGMYVLAYKDADAAKRAYVRYTNYEGAEFAAPDVAVEAAGEGDDEEDADLTRQADDGPDADGAEQAATDAPEVDTSTYDADKQALEDAADMREREEASKAEEERTAVVVLIDTMVAQDYEGVERLSVLADAQEAVADDDPDREAKIEAQHRTHGSRMVDAIRSQDPEAHIVAIEALDSTNYGSVASVLAAAQLAAASGAGVVNMSFAGYNTTANAGLVEAARIAAAGRDGEVGDPEGDAGARAEAADDAVVLAAAGNQGQDAKYFLPAAAEDAHAVGALDADKVAALRGEVARELFPELFEEVTAAGTGGDAEAPEAASIPSRVERAVEDELATSGAVTLDDGQLAELDSEVASRIYADPDSYKLVASNHGDAVEAWVIASSTSEAAALASGYAASAGGGWRDSLASSPISAGDSREFAAPGAVNGPEDGGGQPEEGDGAEDGEPSPGDAEDADEEADGVLGFVRDAVVERGLAEGVWAAETVAVGNSVQSTKGSEQVIGYAGTTSTNAQGTSTAGTRGVGKVQEWTAAKSGVYTVRLSGAAGGPTIGVSSDYKSVVLKGTMYGYRGGHGGTATARLFLEEGDSLYLAVGGRGARVQQAYINAGSKVRTPGGWNGGGNGYSYGTANYTYSYGGGGGATYASFVDPSDCGSAGDIQDMTYDYGSTGNPGYKYMVAIAGGGGGADCEGTNSGYRYDGGDGGGLTSALNASSGTGATQKTGFSTTGQYRFTGFHGDATVSQGPGGGGGWYGGTGNDKRAGGGSGHIGGYDDDNGTDASSITSHVLNADGDLDIVTGSMGGVGAAANAGQPGTDDSKDGEAGITLAGEGVAYYEYSSEDGRWEMRKLDEFAGSAAAADADGAGVAASSGGFDLVGWSKSREAGAFMDYAIGDAVYESCALYPVYGDYSVKYTKGSHSSSSESTSNDGDAYANGPYKVKGNIFEPEEGWRFAGWRAEGATSESPVQPGASLTAAEADPTVWAKDGGGAVEEGSTVTLVAQWVETDYTLHVDVGEHAAEGVASYDASESAAAALRLPAAPEAAGGYTFSGWAVSYKGGSGSPELSALLKAGSEVAPSAGSASGWAGADGAVVAWYASGEEASELPQRVSAGVTVNLVAQWVRADYEIGYDLASGTAGAWAPEAAQVGEWFEVSAPRRDGYLFAGWSISGMDSAATHYVGSESETATGTTASGVLGTRFKDLRSTAGEVRFEATWSPLSVGFGYTGSVQTFTAPASGVYELDLYGAQGGSPDTVARGGYGGHTRAYVELSGGQQLKVAVGGAGAVQYEYSESRIAGGWNGGGMQSGYWSSSYSGTFNKDGAGGGATHVALVPATGSDSAHTTLDTYKTAKELVVAVAGGGGGGAREGSSGYYGGSRGGDGGGIAGEAGWQSNNTSQTQSAAGGAQAGPGSTSGVQGSFGAGASADSGQTSWTRGAGGGGWWGGNKVSGTSWYNSGGGGGSGHLGESVLGVGETEGAENSRESYTGYLGTAGFTSVTERGTNVGNGRAYVTLVADYTVAFSAGEGLVGSGTMQNAAAKASNSYILPSNGFTAPTGAVFAGWKVTGSGKVVSATAVSAGAAFIADSDAAVAAGFVADDGTRLTGGSMKTVTLVAQGGCFRNGLVTCTFAAPGQTPP